MRVQVGARIPSAKSLGRVDHIYPDQFQHMLKRREFRPLLGLEYRAQNWSCNCSLHRTVGCNPSEARKKWIAWESASNRPAQRSRNVGTAVLYPKEYRHLLS